MIYNNIIKKYPNAEILDIKRKKEIFNVEFIYNNREYEAEYDKNGNWLLTRQRISYPELPAKIIEHLKSGYSRWKIQSMGIIEKPDVLKYYEIGIAKGKKEIELYYEYNGDFIKSVINKKKAKENGQDTPEQADSEDNTQPVSEVYSLSYPDKVMNMPSELLEISGMAIVDDNRIACIQDESGIIYIYDAAKNEISEFIQFAGIGDYEDIAFDGGKFYILRSDNRLSVVKNIQASNPLVLNYIIKTGCAESEGLFFDQTNNKLIIASKSRMAADKDIHNRYVYILRNAGEAFTIETVVKLDKNQIMQKLPGDSKKTEFNPSAVAVHPVTNHLYVLSASDRMLIVCDTRGTIVKAYLLDPGLFSQPEGIAFYPDGNMLISNEGNSGKKNRPGNILLFYYNEAGEEM